MPRRVNQAGIDLLHRWEGYHRRLPNGGAAVYLCPANVYTAGWGSTRGPDGAPLKAGDGPFRRDECEDLFERDLALFSQGVERLLKVEVNDNEFAALVSFAYNLGLGALRSSTLLRLVNAGDRAGAAEQFGRWVNAGGRRMPGLVARREAERQLFLTPLAQSAPAATYTPPAETWVDRFHRAFRMALRKQDA